MHRRGVPDRVRRYRAAGELRAGRSGGGDRECETLGDVRTRQLSATPVRKQKAVILDIAQLFLPAADQSGGLLEKNLRVYAQPFARHAILVM